MLMQWVTNSMNNSVTRKIGVDMKLNNDYVFVLKCYDCQSGDDSEILGVFKHKEDAVYFKNEYIREMFDIEEEIPDEDLVNEVSGIEFNIERYAVK